MTGDGEEWTCADCGIALPDGATPCPACGARREAADRPTPAGGAADAGGGVYIARGAKNPLANAAFLAVQALTHPNRSLVLDTAEAPGDRFPRWLAVPRDQAPWPASVPDADVRAGMDRIATAEDLDRAGGLSFDRKPRARASAAGAAPTLTPVFNYALIIVLGFTAAAFAVEIAMGFTLGGSLTDAQKTLSATADWILKSGIGAFLGLLGSKTIK